MHFFSAQLFNRSISWWWWYLVIRCRTTEEQNEDNISLSAYNKLSHYNDVMMSTRASQITSLMIVYSKIYSVRSKKTSKLRVTGLYVGNSLVTGKFPAQRASNAENGSIWWRHHQLLLVYYHFPAGISQKVHQILSYRDQRPFQRRDVRLNISNGAFSPNLSILLILIICRSKETNSYEQNRNQMPTIYGTYSKNPDSFADNPHNVYTISLP